MTSKRRSLKQRRQIRLADLTFDDQLILQSGATDLIPSAHVTSEADLRPIWAAIRDEALPLEGLTDASLWPAWPGERSYCWWLFESPEQRDSEQPEDEQLFRLGVMPPVELRELHRQATAMFQTAIECEQINPGAMGRERIDRTKRWAAREN